MSSSDSSRRRKVLRRGPGLQSLSGDDDLAVEEPLEIRVDTRPVSITMRTPGHDVELALGFLVSEGLIRKPSDVLKTDMRLGADANVVDVFLSPDVRIDFAQLTRHVFASSSCGVCGKATIDSVRQQFPKVKTDLVVDAETIVSMPAALQKAQETFQRTGGLHAAALFDRNGELLIIREDVGRHNAVDKVLGYGLQQERLPFAQHVLLVSGRASFEIMQKALAGGIPIVTAVSAPSSLAVEFAEESGQTLIGFLRGENMNIYAHPERIR